MTNGTNGNGSWQKWLIGVLTAALLAGGAGLVKAVSSTAERVAAVEAAHRSDHDQITATLQRIEDRLDRLIERSHK